MTPIHHSRPKVLSLVWFKIYPALFGGQKGIALFNKYLGRHFEVDCLCSSDNALVADAGGNLFTELAVGKSQFYRPANWIKLRRWLRSKPYDHVIVEFPYYGLPVWLLKQKRTKLIIHMHNIEARRFKSFGNKGWRLLKQYERWCLKKADLVLFKTAEDERHALKEYSLQQGKSYVLPYGIERLSVIDKAEAKQLIRQKHDIRRDEKILLFAGTLDYAPNAEAVRLLSEHIEPLLRQRLPSFKIIICGRNESVNLPSHPNVNIIFAGLVEDVHPYFAAADCFLDPVRNVHGIQTKILDALNYNLNVVCFIKAIESLPAYLSPKLFSVAEDHPAAFADAIVPALSATFDTAQAFYQDYSWEAIVARFANHLNEASA